VGCPTREQLSAFVDGAATPDEASSIEAHLAECDSCASEAAWFAQVTSASAYADTAMPAAEEGTCLAAEDLAEYAEGRGGPGFRGRVERHLAACADCRRTVAYLNETAIEAGVAITPETSAAARAERMQKFWSGVRAAFVPAPIWSAPVYAILGALATLLVVAVVLPKTGHSLPVNVRESASELPGANPSMTNPENPENPESPGNPGMPGSPDMQPGAPPSAPGMPGSGPGSPPSPPTILPPLPPVDEGLKPPPPPPMGSMGPLPGVPSGGGRSGRRHSGGGSTPPPPPPSSGGGAPPPPASGGAPEKQVSFWDMELATTANLLSSTKPEDLEEARQTYEAYLRHPTGSNEQQQNAWANYSKVCNKLRLPIDVALQPQPGHSAAPEVVLEPAVRIGGVDSAVLALYGDPSERMGDPIKGETLKYGQRGLAFTVQNGKLISIILTLPSAGAVDGVRVGDKSSVLADRYGEPTGKDHGDGWDKWKYSTHGLVFTIRSKIITRIDVKEPAG